MCRGFLTVVFTVKERGVDISYHFIGLDIPLYLHVKLLILLCLRRTFHSVKTIVYEK